MEGSTVDGDVNMPQAGLCGEKLLLMEKEPCAG